MKILFVISYFFPAWEYGGPGKLIYELSNALLCSGHEVDVYTTDAFSKIRRRTKSDNLVITNKKINIKIFKNLSNYAAYFYKFFIPNPFRVLRALRNHEYDIIHIHEFFTPLPAIVSFWAIKNNIPYLISAHGSFDFLRLKHRSLAKKIVFILWGNYVIKHASGFVAATEEEKKEYLNIGIPDNKIFFVNNGIDLKIFNNLPERGAFRKKFQIGTDAMLITYLGRIHALKGLGLLIQSLEKIGKSRRLKICIAGSDDGYITKLQNLALSIGLSDMILFPGVLSGLSKLELYRDSDVFVYPSIGEGFSLAILEAGAAGLPLLITKDCKFSEVGRKKAGLVVETNPKALAEGVSKLLQFENLRKEYGKNARSLIKEKYSIENMKKELIRIYSLLLKTQAIPKNDFYKT